MGRCEMGGLTVNPNEPSPWYEFEMLKKDASGRGGSPSLFLHYKVTLNRSTGRGFSKNVISADHCLLATDELSQKPSAKNCFHSSPLPTRAFFRSVSSSWLFPVFPAIVVPPWIVALFTRTIRAFSPRYEFVWLSYRTWQGWREPQLPSSVPYRKG